MGVGVDAELAAELDPAAQPPPVEIEPPGVAIDLDRDTVLGAGGQHALDVQVIARAAQQLPAGHVTNDGDEWVGGCAHEAFGLRLPVEAELPVDAADDEIEAAQHVVRIVERAVRKDIGLDALEDAEAAAERRVEAVDLSLLLLDLLDREAAGVMRRLRVIGDANVLVAVGEAGLRHCFQRIGAVRGGSVGVQNARVGPRP